MTVRGLDLADSKGYVCWGLEWKIEAGSERLSGREAEGLTFESGEAGEPQRWPCLNSGRVNVL